MILNGRPLPADAPQGMLALADKLASLGRPAGPGEVPGEAAAMAAFSRAVAGASVSPAGGEPAHHKPARRPPPRRRAARPARLAGGLFVVMVGLGSAAAYADVLPGPVQDFAHRVIGAPPAHASGSRPNDHQKTTHRPGTPRARVRRGASQPKPGMHGKANGHHKGAKPGKAKGKAKHVHRPNPAKRRAAAKPTHPPHPSRITG